MRHAATRSLLERRDVIIVASVSCIYGIGARKDYGEMLINLEVGRSFGTATALLRRLVDMQYERNDIDFHRGTFRVRGDVVEVFPAYEETNLAVRVEFWGDEVERIVGDRPAAGQGAQGAAGQYASSRQPLRHPRGHRRSQAIE
jgi:excinuclease ABC subunit B